MPHSSSFGCSLIPIPSSSFDSFSTSFFNHSNSKSPGFSFFFSDSFSDGADSIISRSFFLPRLYISAAIVPRIARIIVTIAARAPRRESARFLNFRQRAVSSEVSLGRPIIHLLMTTFSCADGVANRFRPFAILLRPHLGKFLAPDSS